MNAQGALSQVVWGVEAVAPGQRAAALYGLKVKNFTFQPKPTFERTANIDPRGMKQRGRVLKWDLPISFDAEMSVDDLARLRVHQQGFASIATVATGVYDWTIRDLLSTDSLATDMSSLSFEVDRNDGYATLLTGAQLQDYEVSVVDGKIASTKFSGMACAFTNMADPVLSTSTGTFAGAAYVRFNRKDTDAQDTANPIKFKCTTAGPLGTAQFKFTKGATAYAGSGVVMSSGVWTDVVYGDGTYASGDPLEPVQVMIVGTGNFALNDEFTVNAQRVRMASPTYPSKNALTAVGARVAINGVAYVVTNFDLKFTAPKKDKRGLGSKYTYAILPDGQRSVTIKLQRDYTDRDLYLKMLSSTAISFSVVMTGDLLATVGGASYYERHTLTSASAQVLQAGADIPNEKLLPESIDIAPFYDGTNIDLSEAIRCSLPTLT